jgi:BirA family biotin operon repressor/biotin-[acetyl-CoA-carboxylase] ligase
LSIPGKSLTFSIIVNIDLSQLQSGLISLLTGVAVAEAFHTKLQSVKLKWPNDIIVKKRKIGGILIESRRGADLNKQFVIGIGLNINLEKSDFPQKLKSNATSLQIETDNKYSIEQICAGILNRLEYWLGKINSPHIIISAWESFCSHMNENVTFHSGDDIVKGLFVGLTKQGEAMLESDGERTTFNSGILDNQ